MLTEEEKEELVNNLHFGVDFASNDGVVITCRTEEGDRKNIVVERKNHSDIIGSISYVRRNYLWQLELYRRLWMAQHLGPGHSIGFIMDRVEEFNAQDSWWGRRKLEKKRKKRRKEMADARTKTREELIAQGNYVHECAYNNDRGEIIYPGTPINVEGNPVIEPSWIDQSIREAHLNEIRGGENFFRIIWQGYASGKAHDSDHKCAICNDILHNNHNFPEDYPERLKLCCKCTDAWYQVNGATRALNFYVYSPAIMKEHYNAYKQEFEKMFQLEVV